MAVETNRDNSVLILDQNPFFRQGLASFFQSEYRVIAPAIDEHIDINFKLDLILLGEFPLNPKNLMLIKQLRKAQTPILTFLDKLIDTNSITELISLGVEGYVGMGCGVEDLKRAASLVLRGGFYVDPTVGKRFKDVLSNFYSKSPAINEENLFSTRELDVLRLVVEGKTNKEIGDCLVLSPHTVKTYVSSLIQKANSIYGNLDRQIRRRSDLVNIVVSKNILASE